MQRANLGSDVRARTWIATPPERRLAMTANWGEIRLFYRVWDCIHRAIAPRMYDRDGYPRLFRIKVLAAVIHSGDER